VAFAAPKLRKRHLGENLSAVPMQARALRIASPARRLPTFMQKLLDPLVVGVALQLGNDQIFRLRTQGLRPGPSEHRFGVRAPVEDDAGFVGLDKSVERGC